MNVFCDTTVFVAASLQAHPHYSTAKATLERICLGTDAGFTSGHCLAETFSVLSRIPTSPKLTARDVLAILETNIIAHFNLLVLESADYPQVVRDLGGKGLGGGRIYDFLHLTAARKHTLDRIYTFNDAEWKKLAPDLERAIMAPPQNP